MDRVEYQSVVIQDIINLHKSDELNLNPWYQRRAVWLVPQKAYLINTIFEKKPIPSIYIRHYLDLKKEKSVREVVDGQQRIRAILEYVEDVYPAPHPRLDKRVKYSELSPTEKTAFRMTSLSVGYLIQAEDSDVIEIFGRLNSVAKTLNSQEKRNAKFSGEMKRFCLKEAAGRVQIWKDLGIFSATDIARMQEVEFVSDLVLNLLSGLSDYSSAKLDKLYSEYDDKFSQRNTISHRIDHVFEIIASLPATCIRDTIFSRSPLFFSLFIILESMGSSKISLPKLEEKLFAIDRSFRSTTKIEKPKKDDADFYMACTASTQRIKNRQIRDRYLRKHIG